jgi:hypothetical protein
MFTGTWARRGLKTLSAGLLLDAAFLGLAGSGVVDGPMVDILIMPLVITGWITMIGLALTVLSLLAGGGRRLVVGLIFLAAPVAAFASNEFTNTLPGPGVDTQAAQAAGIWLGMAAAGAVALGMIGIGLLAIQRIEARPGDPPSL